MAATSEALVRRVCEGWDKLGPDEFREIFSNDCAYENMPMPGVNRGPDAIADVLKTIGDGYEVKLRIESLVADGDLLMVERVESFTKTDGTGSFELPVVGVFQTANGKIAAWRDYFHFDPTLWGMGET